MNIIAFNIWDDYFDDDFVPIAKTQKTDIKCVNGLDNEKPTKYRYKSTFRYLPNLSVKQLQDVLLFIYNSLPKILSEIGSNAILKLSKNKIDIENLTHIQRESLVKFLKKNQLNYKGYVLSFFSES